MEIFTHRIFTHQRIIFVFLLAILLPSLIAGYLSLSTFPKRREAVKKLLESNLWISGEAALKSIEGMLLAHEQDALKTENFTRLIQSDNTARQFYNNNIFSEDSAGQFFLLNTDFRIFFPETEKESSVWEHWEKEINSNQLIKLYRQAEYFEFIQKNFGEAAGLYRSFAASASSKQYRAIAMESLGRCLFSIGKLDEAEKVYKTLSGEYGQFVNRAGHPFGITAILRIYAIARERKHEADSLGILINLYKQLREGRWPVNQSVYDFYISEIESILDSKLIDGKYPDIRNDYRNLKNRTSEYKKVLLFTNLLKSSVIPRLKEKLSLLSAENNVKQGRFPGTLNNEFFMVSYSVLSDFQPGQTFYCGYCWDLNQVRNRMIAGTLNDLSKESGLNFEIVVEGNQNMESRNESLSSEGPMALTFRIFPLPWKLLVSHPEMKAIEKTTKREIFFYGILMVVIVVLMLLGAVLIARDIFRESETTRMKTEFVNNISHELKTPLTLIRLYGETLQRRENLTNEEKKESYEIITKESERLSHLINNVLDFSRIETGRKEFDFKKGYMQKVISETLESYRYHLEKKGFAIHSDIADNLPEMNFDGEAIASILINLLSNAMKFSLKQKEVTVKLFRDDGSIVLQVADKGIGIPPEEIPKIFERFYRVENKAARETRGSGLGLTLVKHITEAHNGKIEVKSGPGKGSIFSIILPIT